jgi:hypothetical protein
MVKAAHHPLLPAAPRDGLRYLWMRSAWLASGSLQASKDATGAVAVRPTAFGYDQPLAVAGSQGSDRSAIAQLLVQAAGHGACLRGASCFLWPDLGPSRDFALLVDAGIREVHIPSLPVPQRSAEELNACLWTASNRGVSIETLDPEQLFPPLRDALRNA